MAQRYEETFDGSLLVNGRFISGPLDHLLKPRAAGEIHLRDLMHVLNFVENCALSTALLYDPTVPKETLAPLEDGIAALQDAFGRKAPECRRIEAPGDGMGEDSLAALDSCRAQVAGIDPAGLDEGAEGRIDDADAGAAVAVLEERASLADAAAEDLSRRVFAGRMRGRKFVGALVHPRFDREYRAFVDLSRAAPPDRLGLVVGHGINVFRIHLLMRWAEANRSAHLVGRYGDWSTMANFSRYVWHDFLEAPRRRGKASDLEAPELAPYHAQLEQLAREVDGAGLPQSIPPIGLTALMRADGEPGSLLREAMEMVRGTRAGNAFRKELWKASSADPRRQRELTEELYDAAERHTKTMLLQEPELGEKKTLLVPHLLDLGGKLAATAVLGQVIGPALAGAVVGAPSVLDVFGKAWSVGKAVYRTTGRRGFLHYFHRTTKDLRMLDPDTLEAQVKKVFGKRLVTA
mgnify:FL=1